MIIYEVGQRKMPNYNMVVNEDNNLEAKAKKNGMLHMTIRH